MCLNPIRIKNRQKHYTADGMQRRWLMVPCGHCAECIALKRRQWYMRNYWHCKECYDSNGFVLFDTLTYDDAHLPHLSRFLPSLKGTEEDFACFDKRDLDNFMKRLRINLTRDGYDCKGNLDYFYSTEYGSDDEYIDDRGKHRNATFRPHYHFLFYCRVPNLSPDKLAVSIYEAWDKGRTDCMNESDGLRRGYMYLHNVFGKGYTRNDDLSLRKVSNYVAKYVTKEPEYQKKVDERVAAVTNAMLNRGGYLMCEIAASIAGDYASFSEFEEAYRKYVDSYVGMFHNQSHGFGSYALKFPQTLLDIFFEGVVRMPDEKRIVASVPVPLYYVRKLYCRLVEPVDGHHSWTWNRKGKEFLRRRAERSLRFAADKYTDAFLNMTSERQRLVLGLLDEGDHGGYLNDLDYWHSRFRALAEYELFYRDRFIPVSKPCTMDTAVEGSLYLPLPGAMSRHRFIQDDDGDLWKLRDGSAFRYDYVSPEEEQSYLFRDRFFDDVLDCFSQHFEPLNRQRQDVFDKREELSRKYKTHFKSCDYLY